MKSRITLDSRVMTGKPVIRGTRVPVDLIVRLIAQGKTFDEVLSDYPQLTRKDIQAALEYASQLMDAEQVFPLTAE
ncbi:MAG TPA: DUF433 domain-containing protein [archaeon]|nr:DUF433 domain-containing protein [archaeon]